MFKVLTCLLLLCAPALAQRGEGYTPPSAPLPISPANGGSGAISITAAPYNAVADGIALTGVTTTSSSAAVSSSGHTFVAGDVGKMIAVAGAGAAGATLNTTVSAVAAGNATMGTTAGTSVAGTGTGWLGTDNATALQSAMNAATAAGVPLFVPVPSGGGCYSYTAPLTISGNLTIYGSSAQESWNGGINVPSGTPPLLGSVMCPSSNGSDAVDISGTSLSVNIHDIGLYFQTALSGTGDGWHYVPAQNVQGLSGSTWSNVIVYGHDGNHYGFNLTNPIIDTFLFERSYGGGEWNLTGNSTAGNYGNSVFVHPYGQVIVGGSAHGFHLSANASQRLALLTFIRPQAITDNVFGITPVGNPPTSAQLIWNQDPNVQAVRLVGPDLETNVGSSIQLGAPAFSNDYDWGSLFTDAANVQAPAWTSNGLMYGPVTRNLTDTTSSGTVPVSSVFAFPGTHALATNATTYTILSTLIVPPPIVSTNVTATGLYSIYATGGIDTTGDLVVGAGAFINGTTQINTNSTTHATEIGDGTTSGMVTIGGASNTVKIGAGSAAGVTFGSTAYDSCTALTTTSGGVLGCTASDQRVKNDDGEIAPKVGLNTIMAMPAAHEFHFKDGYGPGGQQQGFFAQDVQKIRPDLVRRGPATDLTPDGELRFDPGVLVPDLVQAMKAQQGQIDALRWWLIGLSGVVVVLVFVQIKRRYGA